MSSLESIYLVEPQDGIPMTTSLLVADVFEKQHKDVLRSIQSLDCSAKFHQRNFAPMTNKVEIGKGAMRDFKAYSMTRDGFSFLVMGFTGKRAAQWKERFLEAFNRMEQELLKGQRPRLSGQGQGGQMLPSLTLKPALRSQAMRAAVQTARLSGGTEEDVKRLYEEFCALFAARPDRPNLRDGLPFPDNQGLVEEFVAEEMTIVDIDPNVPTPRHMKTQAKDLYEMFRVWCRGRGTPARDIPTHNLFGRSIKIIPGVERTTPKNKVFYNIVPRP